MHERNVVLQVKTNLKRSSEAERKCARLEYLLGRRELELEKTKSELKGEREVNSLCAAFLMYMLIKHSNSDGTLLSYEVDKEEANLLIGRYFAMCEDKGNTYKLNFCERSTAQGDGCAE